VKRSALGWLGCVALLACEPPPKEIVKADRTAPPTDSAPSPSAIAPTPSATAPVAAEPPAAVTKAAAIAPPAAPATPAEPPSLCNEQTPQPFLVSAHFDAFNAAGGTAREWEQVLDKAVRYRTERYGYVKGFGDAAWNASTPAEQARVVTFFGVPVSVHRRIAPALSCVETAIRARCADHPYQPYVLSGLRKRNTYLNGEVSNHVYGIALDVDPTRNPCCGCIGEWRASERCQNDKTKFQRMDMPSCWVTEFERFGFYWLGHSKLEDTMHFEFLADPSQIAHQAELVR
jgi:D-alanyl-D-alanine carboxypeptidase